MATDIKTQDRVRCKDRLHNYNKVGTVLNIYLRNASVRFDHEKSKNTWLIEYDKLEKI